MDKVDYTNINNKEISNCRQYQMNGQCHQGEKCSFVHAVPQMQGITNSLAPNFAHSSNMDSETDNFYTENIRDNARMAEYIEYTMQQINRNLNSNTNVLLKKPTEIGNFLTN